MAYDPQSPQVYDGDDIIVTVDGKTTLHATNHTLNVDMATNERRTKTTRSITRKPGDISWSVNVDALFVVNDAGEQYSNNFDLLKMMLEKEEVTVILVATSPIDQSKTQYTGKAWVTNFTANTPSGEDATFTATLTGSGDLKEVTDVSGLSAPFGAFALPETTETSEDYE